MTIPKITLPTYIAPKSQDPINTSPKKDQISKIAQRTIYKHQGTKRKRLNSKAIEKPLPTRRSSRKIKPTPRLIESINIDNSNSPLSLINAINRKDLKAAKELIESDIDIEQTNRNGNTALALAAFEGYITIVKILLEKKANIDHQNNIGDTPLINASITSRAKTTALLIKHGANVNHVNNFNGTALTLLLNNKGLYEHNLNDKQHSRLMKRNHYLLKHPENREATVKTLVENGADVNHRIRGLTPLMLAAKSYLFAAMNILLKKQPDLELENKGFSAVSYAAERGFTNGVKLLAEKGASLEKKYCVEAAPDIYPGPITIITDPLCLAAINGHRDTVEYLLKTKKYNRRDLTEALNICAYNSSNTYNLDPEEFHKNIDDILCLLIDSGECFEDFHTQSPIKQLVLEKGRLKAFLKMERKSDVFQEDILYLIAGSKGRIEIDIQNLFKFYKNKNCLEKLIKYLDSCKGDCFIKAVYAKNLPFLKVCYQMTSIPKKSIQDALQSAIALEYYEIAQWLITKGASTAFVYELPEKIRKNHTPKSFYDLQRKKIQKKLDKVFKVTRQVFRKELDNEINNSNPNYDLNISEIISSYLV